jgi:hypothetical protein
MVRSEFSLTAIKYAQPFLHSILTACNAAIEQRSLRVRKLREGTADTENNETNVITALKLLF